MEVMHAEFEREWERLGELAFRRQEKVGERFRELWRLIDAHPEHRERPWLLLLKDWMLVPFTLWPLDIAGLAREVSACVRSGRVLEEDARFVLRQIQCVPPMEAQEAVSQYEKMVEQGNYEPLLRASEKYAVREKELFADPEFQQQWGELKRLFSVEQFRDRKGIIRRRLVQERNLHPNWEFKWETEGERFQVAFDAFCHRWNLYGMEEEKPLLLKLTVNPTPHGLLIMIPTYWSFDPKRDLNWGEVNRLHKARGMKRQGPKMSEGRLERRLQARQAYEASQAARKAQLKGRRG